MSISLRLQNSQVSEYGKLRFGIDGYGLTDKTLAIHMSDEFTANSNYLHLGNFPIFMLL